MPIISNSNTLYLGSTLISRAYLGSTLIDMSATSFLLDEYPGAAGAWSLRQLSSSTTNVVRVRRDSDNAEADFTATEVADGTLETWVGATGDGFVTTLYDQSGNARNAAQTTAADQPKIVDAGVLVTDGGNPAISVDGVTQYLSANASLDFTTPGAITTLLRHDNSLWKIGAHGGARLYFGDIGFGLSDEFQTQSAFDILGNRQIYTGTFKNGTANFIANNASGTSFSYAETGSSASPFLIGARLDVAGTGPGDGYHLGTISEVILWGADISTTRTAIEQEIATHYGIALA